MTDINNQGDLLLPAEAMVTAAEEMYASCLDLYSDGDITITVLRRMSDLTEAAYRLLREVEIGIAGWGSR